MFTTTKGTSEKNVFFFEGVAMMWWSFACVDARCFDHAIASADRLNIRVEGISMGSMRGCGNWGSPLATATVLVLSCACTSHARPSARTHAQGRAWEFRCTPMPINIRACALGNSDGNSGEIQYYRAKLFEIRSWYVDECGICSTSPPYVHFLSLYDICRLDAFARR